MITLKINGYLRFFLIISFYLIIFNEFIFNAKGIYGNDNSILTNYHHFISSLIETISVKSLSNIESDLNSSTNGIVFLKSLVDYFLFYITGSLEISKKIFFSFLVIMSGFFLDKNLIKFNVDKYLSLILVIFYFSSFSIIDNFIMGWEFVLLQILLSPILFYLYIYYHETNKLVYLFLINLVNIILLVSIQNIFLCFTFYIIFFLTNIRSIKANIILFISLIIVLIICLSPIIINNIFFKSVHDLYGDTSNSTITQGINGILGPIFIFKSASHLNNNFLYNALASQGMLYKSYFLIINTLGLAGIFLMYIRKFEFRNLFFFFYLIDLFLLILKFESQVRFLTNFFDINFLNELENIFFIIFRDQARLSSINDFIYFIAAGYFLNYFFNDFIKKYSKLFIINFLISLIFILFFNQKIISNLIKNYSYQEDISYQLQQESINKLSKYLQNTNFTNILFLPVKTNIKMADLGYFTSNRSGETIDPVKRFSLNNTFYWHTDKSKNLSLTDKIYNCNKDFNNENVFKFINCLSNIDKLNFAINLKYYDEKQINLIFKILNSKKFKIDFFSDNFLIFTNSSYDNDISTIGVNIFKTNQINNFFNNYKYFEFETYSDFDIKNEKSFYKIFINQFKSVFSLISFKVRDQIAIDSKRKTYYLKNQFYNDLSLLIVTLFITMNIVCIFIFKKSKE